MNTNLFMKTIGRSLLIIFFNFLVEFKLAFCCRCYERSSYKSLSFLWKHTNSHHRVLDFQLYNNYSQVVRADAPVFQDFIYESVGLLLAQNLFFT